MAGEFVRNRRHDAFQRVVALIVLGVALLPPGLSDHCFAPMLKSLFGSDAGEAGVPMDRDVTAAGRRSSTPTVA